jgi:chromate reductase, NAD(P)H dehydrogenase (quinone)
MKVLAISGSLRRDSLNTRLLRAAAELAPPGVEVELLDPSVLKELPLYDADDDGPMPPIAARRLRGAMRLADALLIATPEYNGTIPGGLKNAIDWASRPWGKNSFDHMPAAVIGASPGQIGTAVGQQSLRAVLSFCNARQMTAPEAYVYFKPGLFTDDGEVTDESTAAFLADFMQEFRDHTERVLTVLPRPGGNEG